MKLDLKLEKKRLKEYLLYIAIIVGGIVIDQLTKLLAVKFLMGKPAVNII